MDKIKEPVTREDMLAKIKARGCIVEDDAVALKILDRINYYRLTAYFLSFKNEDETYKENTNFQTICGIYDFDRKMRSVLYGVLGEIEITLRSRLAYYHGRKYGALGYEYTDNFNSEHKHGQFLSKIYRDMESNKNKPFVKHHLKNYGGKMPIWAVLELSTFGELSFFYADMHRMDKKEIAKQFEVSDDNLKSWLRCLTDLRNHCAHYERLYQTTFVAQPSQPKEIERPMGKQLFDYILCAKFVYPDREEWRTSVVSQISAIMEEYKEYINLDCIGFPENWEEMLR